MITPPSGESGEPTQSELQIGYQSFEDEPDPIRREKLFAALRDEVTLQRLATETMLRLTPVPVDRRPDETDPATGVKTQYLEQRFQLRQFYDPAARVPRFHGNSLWVGIEHTSRIETREDSENMRCIYDLTVIGLTGAMARAGHVDRGTYVRPRLSLTVAGGVGMWDFASPHYREFLLEDGDRYDHLVAERSDLSALLRRFLELTELPPDPTAPPTAPPEA